MVNKILKEIFQEVHQKIVTTVSPDSVMDVMFSKKVLGFDDYDRFRHVPARRDRCRDLLTLLYSSSHPQTFICLRLALLDDYPRIVKDVDKLLTSPTSQLQQLRLDHSTDGINLCEELIKQCIDFWRYVNPLYVIHNNMF